MQNIVLSVAISLLVIINCASNEARSLYIMDPAVQPKRSMERRSFLKSFCARRCNIGKGGNLCRCNGFHFAGKRTALDSEDIFATDEQPAENMVYTLLENSQKINRQPATQDVRRSPVDEERYLLEEIEELIPKVIAENDQRSFVPDFRPDKGFYGSEEAI